MTKNKNRRGFFRIYEEVNLFYKKIDEKSLTESQAVFDKGSNSPASPVDKLAPEPRKNSPDAQFNKNDVCNINISASGLAFNCEDALKEGDCLMIRIMTASAAAIEAQCKIVYCKNSPTNDNECPYFVGAHFINMKDEDRELLIRHVDKKRLQRRWINGFILALVVTVITLPDVVFGLLLELLHFLSEIFLHVLHLAFEFIESNLDHLVEHLFETDVHQTQIIVFYILVPFVLYGLYRLWRVVPVFYRWCKKKQFAYWSRKKANLLFYWREQSTFEKLKLVVIGATVITCYIFFGM
ncbi:MAG: PilZ domain-containing protein [Methylobacter sp.]